MSLNPGIDAETSNVWGFKVIRALLWRFLWQLKKEHATVTSWVYDTQSAQDKCVIEVTCFSVVWYNLKLCYSISLLSSQSAHYFRENFIFLTIMYQSRTPSHINFKSIFKKHSSADAEISFFLKNSPVVGYYFKNYCTYCCQAQHIL